MSLEYSEVKDDKIRGWIVHEQGKNDKWLYLDNRSGIKCGKLFSSSLNKFFKEVFLPQGFPESVHADYVPYQIWDTVQAFASTILGTLTTHSIMRGVGVGESAATPLAAAVTWILKDGTGMIGRILFAWRNGPELDAQCKKWRLFADVLNDLAMGIELLLPYFSSYTTIVLCISSVMKSLVGVAGGATRAAITQHQALSNNLADVSAKDGSQETCVNLIASLVGIFLLSYINVSAFVEVYIILVAVHIYANYSAVCSLQFETFNEDRLALVVKNYLMKSIILNPDEINKQESVKLFHKPSKELCGFNIVIGESLDKFIGCLNSEKLAQSQTLYTLRNYCAKQIAAQSLPKPNPSGMIFPDLDNLTIYIALDEDVQPREIMNLYFKAFLTGCFYTIGLSMESDMYREALTTSGPISTLWYYAHSKQPTSSQTLNSFIDEEHSKWSKLLKDSEWIQERNLLLVGPYRSYWNDRTFTTGRMHTE